MRKARNPHDDCHAEEGAQKDMHGQFGLTTVFQVPKSEERQQEVPIVAHNPCRPYNITC